MGNTAQSWIDGFLFWDALIVTSLIFADWIIGKERREAMRERVGEWWLYLDNSSYSGLVADDARTVRQFLQKMFGRSWLSPAFVQRTFIYSTAVAFLVLTAFQFYLLFLASSISSSASDDPVLLSEFAYAILVLVLLPVLMTMPAMITPNVISGWLSIGFTLFLLKKMERSTSLAVLLGILICDVVAACLVTVVSFVLLSYALNGPSWGFYLSLPGIFSFFSVVAMAVTNSLPTLIHASLGILFILSKLVSPLLKKPTEILLIRFYESKKGVLTQLAIGLGALAKIVQEIVKYAGT